MKVSQCTRKRIVLILTCGFECFSAPLVYMTPEAWGACVVARLASLTNVSAS